MHRHLFSIIAASLLASGCATSEKVVKGVAQKPFSKFSFVHKQTIQQGNILNSEALDKLETGMSMEEVRLALGTPSFVDVFHQQRWDYIYWLQVPGEELVHKNLSLYFSDDGLLDRIAGNYEPDEKIDDENERIVVSVPDHEGKGVFQRTLDKVGDAID
ncbi:MAG TPA: cell envelope protein SmpA [Gammaproteobacteria bacterium]|nr:cell envelope protein SmpA [Gammaproteobacteria bacterium]